MIDNEWSLREEILIATHRWPIIVGFGLAGILIGLIAALVWPASQRASIELNVSLNIYQVEGDPGVSGVANPQFTFAEDYKNWQMDNLNSFVFMDYILDQTLERLRAGDPYWGEVDRSELREMLHVYWRNAGRWRLVAQHPQSIYARQAVSAWSGVILDQIAASLTAANQSLQLDLQLRSLIEDQSQATAQLAALESHLTSLDSFSSQIKSLPVDQPLNQAEYLALQVAVSQISTEAGIPMLAMPPAAEAPAKEFADWIDASIAALEQKIQGQSAQINTIEDMMNELAAQYALTTQASFGISPNLIVQKLNNEPAKIMVVRPVGTFVFVGGILGLSLWGILWIAKIALSQKSNKANPIYKHEETD